MMLTKIFCRFKTRRYFNNRFFSSFSAEDEPIELFDDQISNSQIEDAPSVLTKTGTSNKYGWFLYEQAPKNVDPQKTSVLLFPGQGSHFIGMGAKLIQDREAKRLFEAANSQLNRNILKLCLEGPKERLELTVNSQLAIYITSIASLYKLRTESPELLESCVAAAGFSVGEIAALVFAGSLTFEEGLHLVRVRADAMQRACNAVPSGMATVFLQHSSDLAKAMSAAREYCQTKLNIMKPVCQVAIKLYSDTRVVAGHTQALDFLQNFAKDFKIRRVVKLPVNGAFHTPLMFEAYKPVKSALDLLELSEPQIPVLSNHYCKPYRGTQMIRRVLAKQAIQQVNWEACLHALYSRPKGMSFPHTFEVGPGNQLGAMLKVVNRTAHQFYRSIDV